MLTSKVREKGQVTLPLRIRNRLLLVPGDQIVFSDTPEGVRIAKLHPTGVEAALAEDWLSPESREDFRDL